MSVLRRRIAALGAVATPLPLIPRASTTMVSGSSSTTTLSAGASNTTAEPYYSAFDHGLNGVDQPTNLLFKDMLWWTLGIMGLIVLLLRIFDVAWFKLRQLSAMSRSSAQQDFWKTSQWRWMPELKKHLIYAPLWKKRHNREIKLSSAIGIGTLPSRLHFIVLVIYVTSNFVYMLHLHWSKSDHDSLCAELRGRSGTLAAVNLVPLIILAGRNNPLIGLLKISFDTYNLLHRWLGRLVVMEVLVHLIAWLKVQIRAGGMASVSTRINSESFISAGLVGTIAFLLISVLSLSPIRHAFYETFLNVHIVLAFIALAMTWVHCATAEVGRLPQLPWVVAIFVIWLCDRFARMLRLVYANWSSRGFTEAVVTPLPGETSRVTMHLPRHLDVKPGMHAYIRFKEICAWESHPFSIAWVEHFPQIEQGEKHRDPEKPATRSEIMNGTTRVSFLIGAHTGFTRMLYNKASMAATESIRLRAAMEGPYAGHHSLESYGHAILFAGATGITHQLSYIKPMIEAYSAGTVATRRLTLVWIIRDHDAMTWVKPWMDEILRLPNRREILRLRIHITRPKNKTEIKSASSTVQMFPGRPNIPEILKEEVENQIGAMCVTVCGPGGLADDVRLAVRDVQRFGTVVDFVEESFTW